jgi:hypothetical protein
MALVSGLLAVVFLAALVGVVVFGTVLVRRAGEAHHRGMDRIRRSRR